METQKNQTEIPPKPAMSSCRRKVKDDATFFEDVKDHIDELIHASMDEHKTCVSKRPSTRCLDYQRLSQTSKLRRQRESKVNCLFRRRRRSKELASFSRGLKIQSRFSW